MTAGHAHKPESPPDYYEILGIDPGADLRAIKEAYRRLARTLHPDVSADPEHHERFRRVSEAYKILSDASGRRNYDALRLLGIGLPFARFREFATDPQRVRRTLDKAGRFFAAASGLTRRTERRPGRDLRVEAEISLAESYTGATRTFHYGRDVDCDACKGRGFDKVKTCAVCEGVGSLAASWMPAVRKRCPRCAAKGWIGERTCTPCEGTGRVRLSHTHTATVPEGTPDGARVRVKGQGEGGYQGGDAGDLIIKIRVAPEPGVRRDGDDLVRGLPVDFRAAALGGQADLALPDGKTITLRIPPWSTSGRRLRVVGRGFKDPHSDRRGDLFAVLRVDLPHESDADARSLTLRYLSAAAGSSDIRKDELRDELEAYFAARA